MDAVDSGIEALILGVRDLDLGIGGKDAVGAERRESGRAPGRRHHSQQHAPADAPPLERGCDRGVVFGHVSLPVRIGVLSG